MSLRIIYGRAGTGKSEYCYKEIAEKVKEEKILTICLGYFACHLCQNYCLLAMIFFLEIQPFLTITLF